jgi:Putative zinc-finger
VGHDPERAAATYLAGELHARQRERFERHLLGCDACWGEVQAARRGRALGESLRELAPQRLRERVRGSVAAASAASPGAMGRPVALAGMAGWRGRRRPLAVGSLLAVLVMVAAGVLATLRQADQPAVIAAAVAGYRAGGLDGAAAGVPPPARRLGELRWQGAQRGRLADLEVVAHHYRDTDGRRVTLLVADHSFPEAAGASHPPGAATWVAEADGVVLLCAERPSPSLLLGDDRAQVLAVAARLGLR